MSKQSKVSVINDTTNLLVPLDVPSNLAELQAAYGASCSLYEHKADKKLQQSDTIIVSGIGCSLRVKNNALEVFPGKTHAAQTQDTIMLYRGVHGISQIIILSDRGLITLDAVKFCCEQDIAITMLDNYGNLVQAITPEHESNITLRRAQYSISDTKQCSLIAANFVQKKLAGQLDTLLSHSELPEKPRIEGIQILRDALTWFCLPELPPWLLDRKQLMSFEGRCANAYFDAWRGMPIRWQQCDKKKVPPHWQQVTERTSALSHNHGARWATNPLHAVLNYAYAVLESQCKLSLNTFGFDTACPFLHSDKLHRDSLTYDVMEEHRPKVDDLVLKLFAKTTLSKGDLLSEPTGGIEFNPQFSRYIAAACKLPQQPINISVQELRETVLASC